MIPRFCVVPDYTRVVPGQRIKYMIDEPNTVGGKIYHNMRLTEDERDITITPWDGVALCDPSFCCFLQEKIGTDEEITSFIWRLPYAKGCAHAIDFKRYCHAHGVDRIKDIWGHEHPVDSLDMILTASTWKAEKFFARHGDYRDFEEYLAQCEKYEHSLCITRWNEQFTTEKVYTRGNYQILQDLLLSKDEFLHLADYSKEWGRSIARCDREAVYCFTGLTYKVSKDGAMISPGTDDMYFKAILRNPAVLGDPQVWRHVQRLAGKYFDEFGCGKLWLRGAFKFILPDPIGLLEHICGLPVVGALQEGEMFSQSHADGLFTGLCILERNPHIARSEHCVLYAIGGREAELMDYCGHLANVVIINSYDTTLPRLSGADADGDIVFVLQGKDNKLILKGIDRDLPVVINIDEKATAKKEKICDKAQIHDFTFGSDNRIGEYSNCATKWYNKVAPQRNKDGSEKTDEQKREFYSRCADYVNLIAIVNAKEIDSAKTQVKVNLPHFIQKNSGAFPYFMRYAGAYYAKHKNLSRAPSNMNELCFDIERWHKNLTWAKPAEDFDWSIYINPDVEKDEERFEALYALYREYMAEKRKLQEKRLAAFSEFKIKLAKERKKKGIKTKSIPLHLFPYDDYMENKMIDDEFVARAKQLVPRNAERANYAVEICYGVKTRKKNFAWLIAGDAIARNVLQVEHQIPLAVDGATYDFMYLGQKYIWATYPNVKTPEDERSADWWRELYELTVTDESNGWKTVELWCKECGGLVASMRYDGNGDLELETPHCCPMCGAGGNAE